MLKLTTLARDYYHQKYPDLNLSIFGIEFIQMPINSKIKCPHCGEYFEPSVAFKHELEESIRLEESKKSREKLQEIREKIEKETKEALSRQLSEKDESIAELKKRAEKAEEEEIKIRKEKRELTEAKERFEIEKERQLDTERQKIKEETQKQIEEVDKLKFAEYEKKIADMNKALEEAKRKGVQGSQQLQGEVLELDFENLLGETFADDEVVPVAKGKLGADIIHKVKGKSGKLAGVILWETKRAKWKTSWTAKLREDARSEGAAVAVLVTTQLPKDIENFKLASGIIITSYSYALPLAGILRRSLLQIALAKQTTANKDENLELLFEYFQSDAFRHRFESFAEGITQMQIDLDYEKRSMERVWKKRDVQIKRIILNTSRMYGELQGIMGNTLPDIKVLSLSEGEKDKA